MRSLHLKEYEAYLAVAKAGSFVGGAKTLGITASAMSQIIKRLEDQIGVQLLHRTTRSVSPTDQGERLLTRLTLAFEEIEAATQELADRRDSPAGVVRMVVPRVAYADLIEPMLPRFHAAYPDITLDLDLNDAFADIVGEGYDLGLRLGEYVNPETVAFAIGPSLRQIAVASPSYLAVHGTPEHPRELTGHMCISWRQNPNAAPYAWEFGKGAEQISVSVQGPLIFNDRHAAARAAVDGLGIALWVDHRLHDWIERGDLVPLLADWSPHYPGFFVYYYRDRHISAATRAVIAFLRQEANRAK
jgi:DNA-binding transcriptional LysR family regulator